jgi:hypothetical protein
MDSKYMAYISAAALAGTHARWRNPTVIGTNLNECRPILQYRNIKAIIH